MRPFSLYSVHMITVVPFDESYDRECHDLMAHCLMHVKKRSFDAERDSDMLDFTDYYNPMQGSLLLVALASVAESQRDKVVGTLGLKNEGIIDGTKTGMFRRLYVEPEHRVDAVLPLFRAMRTHVLQEEFGALRFVARRRMGSIFQTYEHLAKHLGMTQEQLDEESLLYTWKLPASNGKLLGKLFKAEA